MIKYIPILMIPLLLSSCQHSDIIDIHAHADMLEKQAQEARYESDRSIYSGCMTKYTTYSSGHTFSDNQKKAYDCFNNSKKGTGSLATVGEVPRRQGITSIEFIKKFECKNGPHLVAYPDGQGYTIGCGTVSYKGEKISEKEALRRYHNIIAKLEKRIRKDYPDYSDNQIVALTSLSFNCENCYRTLKKQGISANLWKKFSYSGKTYMRGLYNRRLAEIDLFYNY